MKIRISFTLLLLYSHYPHVGNKAFVHTYSASVLAKALFQCRVTVLT